ncbi:hypothetical protein BGZ61DRAFT_437873 [Ilyonectria robusta]|uniref:uncharacterized protein n=1 Tax=Ilyonectria robusta TaxID=1079257 RepID=UPI001E8DF4A5|nr:uncharacterized protein BGZ61DRAFT_437873 [Ilyonectria robusta]KAH8737219.1 hypothetical protein BGZ61DRAFT_437873 [Ilyonectria robusta]
MKPAPLDVFVLLNPALKGCSYPVPSTAIRCLRPMPVLVVGSTASATQVLGRQPLLFTTSPLQSEPRDEDTISCRQRCNRDGPPI